MGRAGDAHVHQLGLRRAERQQLFGLDHPQQLGLRFERHVADLVEQERAAMGHAHDARLVALGAGECAAFEAEELTLQEVRRDRRAIHGHEAAAAPAQAMQLARHHLFAGAARSEHHHVEQRRCDALELGGDAVYLKTADQRLGATRPARDARQHAAVEPVARVLEHVVLHELAAAHRRSGSRRAVRSRPPAPGGR